MGGREEWARRRGQFEQLGLWRCCSVDGWILKGEGQNLVTWKKKKMMTLKMRKKQQKPFEMGKREVTEMKETK